MFSFESSFYVGYKPDTKGIQFFDPIVSSSPSPYNMTSTIGNILIKSVLTDIHATSS